MKYFLGWSLEDYSKSGQRKQTQKNRIKSWIQQVERLQVSPFIPGESLDTSYSVSGCNHSK